MLGARPLSRIRFFPLLFLRWHRPSFYWIKKKSRRYLIILCAGIVVLYFNPANIFQNREETNIDVFSYLLAPSIPDDHVHDVTVVLLDDVFVRRYATWPLSYEEYARILSKILDFGPRAVFIDLAFPARSNTSPVHPLQLTLNLYRQESIPVFVSADEATRSGIRSELAGLVQLVSTRTASDYLAHQHYELTRASAHSLQSPALAFLEALCRVPDRCSRRTCSRLKATLSATMDNEPMLLRWGTEPAEANVMAFRCNPEVGHTLLAQIGNLVTGDWRQRRQSCPRHPTLLIDNLLGGFTDAQLQPYLRDQIVIFGVELEGVNNWVSPATHLPLSSAYVHATAVENLLLYGDDYFVRDRSFHGASIAEITKYGAFILIVLVQWAYWPTSRAFRRAHHAKVAYRLQAMFWSLLSFALFLGLVAWIQFFVFRIDPFNIIGMLALLAIVRQIAVSNLFDIFVTSFSGSES